MNQLARKATIVTHDNQLKRFLINNSLQANPCYLVFIFATNKEGMFGNMMGKLQEMQKKSEEVKKRLDTISVQAEAEDGLVKITSTGNRKITAVDISAELIAAGDKEQIEDLCILAINRALEKAEKVYEVEMKDVAKGLLPGMR